MSDSEDILICGANWLGDSIMSMPAVQAYRKRSPDVKITVLAKGRVVELWRMNPAVDAVLPLDTGIGGTRATVGLVKSGSFGRAFIFPNSLRSAAIPFFAGVPERIGTSGHQRSAFLNDVIVLDDDPGKLHQSWEYLQILRIGGDVDKLEPPTLEVPLDAEKKAKSLLDGLGSGDLIGLMPGAARGPSKCWPAAHFAEVGKRLKNEHGCKVVILGSDKESEVCSEVQAGIGAGSISLAGQTNIAESAALLKLCSVVITNDSGGMHLAAATGTKTVAIFGITDPVKTGPMGEEHQVIFQEGVTQSRDIARDAPEARKVLAGIEPERVLDAAKLALQSPQ